MVSPTSMIEGEGTWMNTSDWFGELLEEILNSADDGGISLTRMPPESFELIRILFRTGFLCLKFSCQLGILEKNKTSAIT